MKHFLPLLIFTFSLLTSQAQTLTLSSPDGRNAVCFGKQGKELRYTVRRDGREIIKSSRAGLHIDNRVWEMALGKRALAQPACWMDLLVADSVSPVTQTDTTWHPLYGERSTVRDHYRAATLYLSRHDDSHYRLNIEVRAYDEGIAFRYFLPEHPSAIFHKVVDDLTEYQLLAGTEAWAQEWAQARHRVVPIDSITRPVERALTLRLTGGGDLQSPRIKSKHLSPTATTSCSPQSTWLALLDADTDDWCLTKFVARQDAPSTLRSVMYSPVDLVTYAASPWKIIMTADTPTQLIERNDIVLNLNPPCQIADTSWIRPGKIMRCTKIDTQAGKEVIDFCHKYNFQYMLYDWLWYLPCTSHDGDATQVVPQLDMREVVRYGKERGIGTWLYVNQHALMKQGARCPLGQHSAEDVLDSLQAWGIAGMKSGFVQYASHRWAVWIHDLVAAAAKRKLMMNIHDEYRPSGFSRTYPNLLTQEGICGNEEFPDATHNCTLPFTRMLNGAADYTICYYDRRVKNTHAHQLAASLVFYSPLLTVLWYDTPQRCHDEPEMKWFADLTTTFDDTRVLDGYPGRDITIARRKGDVWFVAAMTNDEARTVTIPLDFLDAGATYTAEIYADDASASTATHVACTTRRVRQGAKLTFPLQARGGVAVRITKQ